MNDEQMKTAGGGTIQPSTSTSSATNAASQSIDIEKLAEKVYQLMRADVRQAQARGNRRNARR